MGGANGATAESRDPRNCGFTVIPKKVALVVGHGKTAALALEAIAIELDRNHPNDALLSAVTVFYTDAHYEAEVAVRIEDDSE